METKDLNIQGIISFNGTINNGLKLHPDNEHILYSMGSKIAIKNIKTGNQNFLTGHSKKISALNVSPCGKYVASGQINYLGFKALVIIWDYKNRAILGKYEMHKVKVEDICFSCHSKYVISLGGKDDGNILVWDIENKKPVCGSVASTDISGNTYTVINTNLREECFVTAGENILKLWRIDAVSKKLHGYEFKVGKLKRTISAIIIDKKDEFVYCGTTTGDIIKARLNLSPDANSLDPVHLPVMIDCYSKIPREAKKRNKDIGDLYEGGIQTLLMLNDIYLIVGAGDGSVELIEILAKLPPVKTTTKCPSKKGPLTNSHVVKMPNKPRVKTIMSQNVFSKVTSTVIVNDGYMLVGTAMCEVYQISLMDFAMTLLITCHMSSIYDIAFPYNYSKVFATASKNDIRLWQLDTQKELLRIIIPNFVCYSLCFSCDGTMIISAWNDGSIKVFTPQTGKLIFSIHKAHLKAVTAVVVLKSGNKIISGGCDAQVRIWSISPKVQKLEVVLIEHAGPITHLDISSDELYVVSSSTDGTCIIWDIEKQVRNHVIMAKTMFTSAKFALNDAQILTCGSDRKIAYWETIDTSMVRELEGSSSDSLNSIDIAQDSQTFVTGSGDTMVKLWDYNLGEVSHKGSGHADTVTACKFSPDGKSIVTVSSDGTIFVWECPVSRKDFDTVSLKSVSSRLERVSVKLRQKVENVDLTARSNCSHHSTHNGDQTSVPCDHDPSQPNQSVCSQENCNR